MQYKKIDKSYHVKISDFGLSILKPQRISRLRGERVGTLTTMAPEILKGSNYNEKAGTPSVRPSIALTSHALDSLTLPPLLQTSTPFRCSCGRSTPANDYTPTSSTSSPLPSFPPNH
jgi:serine/threonine protein kinase